LRDSFWRNIELEQSLTRYFSVYEAAFPVFRLFFKRFSCIRYRFPRERDISRFIVRHGVKLKFIDDARSLRDCRKSSEVWELERVFDLLDF